MTAREIAIECESAFLAGASFQREQILALLRSAGDHILVREIAADWLEERLKDGDK